jgi:alkanesulfonate monooxygenase SsuD/methylene tetrahydromethanopterin reductase-like flavin-dependent oxidoreductase (luciferase family)
VKHGLYLPNFGPFGEARALVELARLAERSGWDGFFVWDHINRPGAPPVVDPWIAMSAIAVATERIRFGALVTPLARRRPWKVARETVSLDRLSNGRLVFGAGLGSAGGAELEWAALGEETDLARRAAMLDEALEVLTGLWSGEPFDFAGTHYGVRGERFLPRPAQSPRIPIWIAAYWPNKAPLRRAARFDGLFGLFADGAPAEVAQLAEAVAYVRAHRTSDAPFDVVHLVAPATPIEPYARAGATWLLERVAADAPLEKSAERIAAGPHAHRPS